MEVDHRRVPSRTRWREATSINAACAAKRQRKQPCCKEERRWVGEDLPQQIPTQSATPPVRSSRALRDQIPALVGEERKPQIGRRFKPECAVYVPNALYDIPLSHCGWGDHEKPAGRHSTRGYVVRREGIEPPTRWLGVA
jgi:hypothetical protein